MTLYQHFLFNCIRTKPFEPLVVPSKVSAAICGTSLTYSSNNNIYNNSSRFLSSNSTTGSNNTSKMSHLIVNAAGYDRLGIVSDITGLVISHGGNVGESVAGRLSSSYFSLMMLITVPEANRMALQTAIQSVHDLHSAVFTVDDSINKSISSLSSTPTIGYSGDFTLIGADNPGIVHTITSALAKAGLSIDKLHTDQEIAPYGGSTLFKMRGTAIAIAPLPKSFDIQKIKNELIDLGDSLNCDITMEDTIDESYQGSFYAG